MTPRVRAPRMLAFFATALAISFGTAACGSLTRPKAQTENSTDTVTVYTLNNSPIDAPSGVWLFGRQAVVINAAFSFDVVFDVNAQGEAKLYTVRYVAGGLSAAHSVALQRYSGTYDALTKAPSSGYVADSLFTTKVGDVFAISTTDPTACGFSIYSSVIYAKLEVLGIDPGTHTVRTRFTVDPNCGFFSLIPSGLPKD
ncbi:MAG: hypothetical protein ACJ796_02880 [Gemmatimonadaceae bacterium]